MLYSIIVPVYKSEKTIAELFTRVKAVFEKLHLNFELVLVEDCGGDNSWGEIKKLCAQEKQVVGIKLSRNFGQHYAITAGLDHAKGDWFIVMDCDLQDQPEEIAKLITKANEGYDVVLARRTVRHDSFFKKTFSRLFYKTLAYLSGSDQDPTVANFGIYSKKVIDSVRQMRESIRYFPTMVRWVGYHKTAIDVEHAPRTIGETSYSLKKLVNLALDIILAYSDKPLRIIIKIGLITSLLAIVFIIYTFYRYFTGQIIVTGYTTIIISIWLLSGIIISISGIVGLYVGKIFEGVKKRPIYFADEKVNYESN